MENSKIDKYEYLNAPCLWDNFKKTYLTSLNVFLNDEKFEKKITTLPKLKSSVITKYEKILQKEENDRLKKFPHLQKSQIKPKKLSSKVQNKPENTNKQITLRYIVIDHELVEITLKAIEESNECNSKLTDPFNSYFHESNEKIRKKALDQIISNILPKDKTDKEDNKQSKEAFAKEGNNAMLYHDWEIWESKYKQYDIDQKFLLETNSQTFQLFQDMCENHNILTLDQKIDYYVYLRKNGFPNNPKYLKTLNHNAWAFKKNIINNNNNSNSINHSGGDINNNNSIINSPSKQDGNPSMAKQSKSGNNSNNDINKYSSELKEKFKIYNEIAFAQQNEKYEREWDTKIKNFQFLKKNFEQSLKFIDKLRMHWHCQEVKPEKVILRECDVTSDRFYFLVTKKYFDFSLWHHLNVSRNNWGDIGGAYLLHWIENYGQRFDYLNISYNKLHKQSTEYLVDILKDNQVKITSLCIGGNQWGDKLFSDICVGISKNFYLNKWFVNDNQLGKISAYVLGTILKYDKKLKTLDVSKNDFGDENIGYMLKGLICNTSLEVLMINDMELTNKSWRVFETTLCINTTLREWFLERNKLNYKGWRVLSDILNKNKYIEYISLVGNNFESEHFDLISEQQRLAKIRVISKTDYFLQMSAANEKLNYYEYFY